MTAVDAALDRYPQISGTITGPDGSLLAGATVQVSGAASRSVSTDANGRYTFDPLGPGDYRIQASGSSSGYGTKYHDGPRTASAMRESRPSTSVMLSTASTSSWARRWSSSRWIRHPSTKTQEQQPSG